jgi:hypothetical protein
MIHLKKYNESQTTVIDPTMDVYDLKELMGEDFEDLDGDIISKINSIASNNPTQTTDFKVYEVYRYFEDEYGKEQEDVVGFYNAISPFHAKIRFILNDKSGDYVDMGDVLEEMFIFARKLSKQRKIEIIENETWNLENAKKILNNIKNPI